MPALKNAWDHLLWACYRRGDKWRQVFKRRVTPLGWVCALSAGLSGVFGMDVIENALVFFFFMGGVLILIELVTVVGRRERAVVTYMGAGGGATQGVGFVGQVLPLRFRVQVNSALRRGRLVLYPWVSGVTLQQFRQNKEPGEERRNVVDRVFKFYRWMWLRETLKSPFSAVSTQELWLKRDQVSEITQEVTFTQRGRWSLIDMRLQLPGAFGLLERSCKTTGERGEVYVAPRVMAVQLLSSLWGGAAAVDSEATHTRAGESLEFLSLRDYRPGDAWRKVNWKAMARTDKAMVQETEEPGNPTSLVHWETRGLCAVGFETAASVVASVVAALAERKVRGVLRVTHGAVREWSWSDGQVEIHQMLAEVELEAPWKTDAVRESGEVAHTFYICGKGGGGGEPLDTGGLTMLKIEGERVNGNAVGTELVIIG